MSVDVVAALVPLALRLGDALLDALEPETREEVRARVAESRDRLPAPGSINAAVAAVIARHEQHERAHEQARAELVRGRYGIGDTARLAIARAIAGERIDGAEIADLAAVSRIVDAALRGELVSVAPGALALMRRDDPPPFVEPGHEED